MSRIATVVSLGLNEGTALKISQKSGVDVMITNFCGFSQFSAKKLAFFLNSNVMIKSFSKVRFVLCLKRHFFAKFFGENILKIITLAPDQTICRYITNLKNWPRSIFR
jgi:hypothetical protein